jgi:hypothetical protein
MVTKMAQKAGPHLTKWWKYHQTENSMVTKTLSPHRIDQIRPFIKSAPEKLKHRFGEWCVASIPVYQSARDPLDI